MNIVNTIRDQIGNKALYMLGAKNLLACENDKGILNALSFRIRGSSKVNYIKIALNCMDLYDIEFGKVHGLKYKIVNFIDNIYVDQLHEIIERETGLYTSL